MWLVKSRNTGRILGSHGFRRRLSTTCSPWVIFSSLIAENIASPLRQAMITGKGTGRRQWIFFTLSILIHLITSVNISAQETPIRSLELTVRNGRVSVERIAGPAQGTPTMRLFQGEQVHITWDVDAVMELHLHGYKLEVRATPGVPAPMRFRARATGRFPVEIHDEGGRHRTILYIEVHPR